MQHDETYMVATDDTNLWKTCDGRVINDWMLGCDTPIRITFCDQDGEPEVLLVPFDGQWQPGMKPCYNEAFWRKLVEGCTKRKRRRFKIRYRFEPRG